MEHVVTTDKINELSEVVQNIAAGNFSTRAKISERSDEFDGLCTGINMLAEELEKRERDVREKIAELKTINDLFVNRELRMVELKKEVETLKFQVDQLRRLAGVDKAA